MTKLLFGIVGLLVVAAILLVAVIAFTAPVSPAPMVSMAAPSRQVQDVPAPRQFQARDGTSLQYYAYPAGPDKIAVLIHGTAGPGTSMHPLAESFRAAGVTTYVLDIRGHGGSGRRGDIDYIGQIDDDLADFVAQLGPVRGGETRTLVGFSGGRVSRSASPAVRTDFCSTAMYCFRRSSPDRQPGARAPEAGSTSPSRALLRSPGSIAWAFTGSTDFP